MSGPTWENNFLYNGGTELNKTTQMYDLYYRNYDPVLGRFGQVDPKASSHGPVSPYHYGLNNPARFNDPLGDDEYDFYLRYNVVAGSHNTGSSNRVYRDNDPYLHFAGRRLWADMLERQTLISNARSGDVDALAAFVANAGSDAFQISIAEGMRLQEAYNRSVLANSPDLLVGIIAAHARYIGQSIAEDLYGPSGKMRSEEVSVSKANTSISGSNPPGYGGGPMASIWFEDDQGKFLFDHWLEGSGDNLTYINGSWGNYLSSNSAVMSHFTGVIHDDLNSRSESSYFSYTIEASTGYNGYSSGYQLLHATSNFKIQGWATDLGNGNYQYRTIATWTDRIDPNYKYVGDLVALPLYLLGAKDYGITISWTGIYNLKK